MTATATARRRLTALVVATAALGAGAAVASQATSAAPATHAVAMYKEDPTCTVTFVGTPSSGGFYDGGEWVVNC